MLKAFSFLGSAILFILIIAGAVFYTSISSTEQPNYEAEAKLSSGREDYVRCYNSINYGSSLVSDVKLERFTYDMDDEAKARLDMLETGFMNLIKQNCSNKVSDYESLFNSYKTDDPTASLPAIRLSAGNPLAYLSFSKEDVQKYFNEN